MPGVSLGTAIALGVGAAASVGSAVIGSKAVGKAAEVQADAAKSAMQLQKEAADESLAFQREVWEADQANQAPFIKAGQKAIGELSGMPAFQGPGADFTKDPGYEFRVAEGMKALERSAASRGGLLSGGTAKAIERYGQDFASNEYANVYNRALGEYLARVNQLSSIAGTGQVSAQNLGLTGMGTGRNVSNINMTAAGNIGNFGQAAAQARASGYLDSASIWQKALTGGVGDLSTLLMLKELQKGSGDESQWV